MFKLKYTHKSQYTAETINNKAYGSGAIQTHTPIRLSIAKIRTFCFVPSHLFQIFKRNGRYLT